ncbi:MAG: hypothetical protein AAFV54_17060 [Pseudomonadota bacterium]
MTTFAEAVAEVKEYIDGKLCVGADIDKAAEAYVWYGIEKGASDGMMSAEIRGADSATGNPIDFSFSAVDES